MPNDTCIAISNIYCVLCMLCQLPQRFSRCNAISSIRQMSNLRQVGISNNKPVQIRANELRSKIETYLLTSEFPHIQRNKIRFSFQAGCSVLLSYTAPGNGTICFS